jgi:hypothetical protein
MADNLEKVNLGMAEFIAKLIDETMEAVIDSQMRQAENIAEIKSAAFLPLVEYASNVITDDEAKEYLIEIFSPAEAPAPSDSIDIGLIEQKLGITLLPEHYTIPRTTKSTLSKAPVSTKGPVSTKVPIKSAPALTTAGYQFMLLSAKMQMSEKHHLILQLLAKDGIPRVVIDNGEINAKVAFTATSLENTNSNSKETKSAKITDPKANKMSGGAITKELNGSTTLLKAEKLSGEYRRYMPAAKLVIENASQTTNSSNTSLFGEITVKFKTIY